MKRYNGIIDEVLYYSKRSENGRWIIPIEVDWDYTLTKCSDWQNNEMVVNDEAFPIMRRWIEEYNVGFILNSMRHDEILKEPLTILENEGIKLYGLRKNPTQDADGNEVTKCFAVFCIDDRNVGCYLKRFEGHDRPYVDWKAIDTAMSPILEYMSVTLRKAEI